MFPSCLSALCLHARECKLARSHTSFHSSGFEPHIQSKSYIAGKYNYHLKMLECVYRLHVYARLNSRTTKLSPRVKQHHNACTHRIFCLIARYKGQGTNNDHQHQQISSDVLRLRLAMHKGSLAEIIMKVPGRARSRYHEPGLGSGFIYRARLGRKIMSMQCSTTTGSQTSTFARRHGGAVVVAA